MDCVVQPLNCQTKPIEYASPGRTPPIGGALPVTGRLKVVMEILGVLMVATGGLLVAHFIAIVKGRITDR